MLVPSRWQLALRFMPWLARSLPRPPENSPRRFVVLSYPRSGSTWLIDLLNSHPQIVCFSEIFAHDHFGNMPHGGAQQAPTWDSYATLRLPTLGRHQRLALYFRYLDEQIYTARHGAAAVGFKMMYFQMARGFGIPAYLRLRSVDVVHLIRLNHLDVILSEEARKVRKFYHAPAGADVPPVRLALEPETLVYRLEQREGEIEAARRQCRALFSTREVIYEDLVEGRQPLHETLSWLGVDGGAELHSDFQKLSPREHARTLTNFEAVAAALRGTRFAQLLR